MSIPSLARQFTEIVGPEHVQEDAQHCAPFAVRGRIPTIVVAPASVEQMAQVLAAAHAAQAAVLPYGGGTRQSLGRVPSRHDVVLRTGRLNRIIEHEPDDLTIAVEAGITMADLAGHLARHNQMLPIDVALPRRSTLGGVIATAADGPRRLAYGTLRDLMIGIRVVEATGRVSKAGGMVVKNVSGFDMMKLYLGSLGSLAVIASANFKLIPRPRAAATVCCSFTSPAAAFELAEQIHNSRLTPAAVEFIQHDDYDLSSLPDTIGEILRPPCLLAVCAEGLPAAVQRHIRDIALMAETAGAREVRELDGHSHVAFWAAIADLPQAADAPDDELLLRLSCLPGTLPAALHAAVDHARRADMALLIDARALNGVAYLRLRHPTADHAALARWHTTMLADWPDLTVLAGPAQLLDHIEVWGPVAAGQPLMARIRQEFDSTGILNPGRFVV